MSYKIVLERYCRRSINLVKLKEQVSKIAGLSIRGPRGNGWTSKVGAVQEVGANGSLVFRCELNYTPTQDRESVKSKWMSIVKRVAKAGTVGNLQGNPWVVVSPEGHKEVSVEAKEEHQKTINLKVLAEQPKELGEINLDPTGYFTRIYGREAQIRRAIDALVLAKKTDWNKRCNTLFDGPCGCGKSSAMLELARMLGKEGEAYRWFDATSTTKAGAIEEIIENPVVPPVLFIEEIEKCQEEALRWLLGVMDSRGEIRRVNYRVGNQAKNVRMVVIASANNVALLKSMMAGALYSRFQNRVYFPAPTREVMTQILTRECQDINGEQVWIEPTLRFAYDKWNMRDPRDIINILSCGGPRLLTGEYQKDYEETMHPFDRDELEKSK